MYLEQEQRWQDPTLIPPKQKEIDDINAEKKEWEEKRGAEKRCDVRKAAIALQNA